MASDNDRRVTVCVEVAALLSWLPVAVWCRIPNGLQKLIPRAPTNTATTTAATTSHRQLSAEERVAAGIGDGLIRTAVGGEDPEDLVEDFLHGLEKA